MFENEFSKEIRTISVIPSFQLPTLFGIKEKDIEEIHVVGEETPVGQAQGVKFHLQVTLTPRGYENYQKYVASFTSVKLATLPAKPRE